MKPHWKAKVKASKFDEWPKYGRAKTGHIALQGDHRGELAFRNIRIRELPGSSAVALKAGLGSGGDEVERSESRLRVADAELLQRLPDSRSTGRRRGCP